MNGTNPVTETIDERVLRLLGLLDVFDLDYDTYYTLLKEELVKVTSSKKQIPAEEFDILKDELKRVRGKKGRFKPKKKKPINANNISNLNSFKSAQKLLPGTAIAPNQKKETKFSENLLGIIKSIGKIVNNIHDTILQQVDLFRSQLDFDRRENENLRRQGEEERLETKKDGFLKQAKKILSPVQSIFDRILKF